MKYCFFHVSVIQEFFSSISANYLYEDFASWDPWLRPKYFSRTYLVCQPSLSHTTHHIHVCVYKSFIKYILWLGKTNCSVSYNLITVSCHVSVISTIHHVQKKIFFSWRASPRKILYLLTDDGILYYLMWTLGVPFFQIDLLSIRIKRNAYPWQNCIFKSIYYEDMVWWW